MQMFFRAGLTVSPKECLSQYKDSYLEDRPNLTHAMMLVFIR